MAIEFLKLPEEMEKAFQDWYGDGNQNMIDPNAIKKFQISVYPHIGKIAGKENREFQENYFNNVTLVWQSAEKLKLSMDIMDIIWMTALEPIIDWEKTNTLRVHKGSPYFYLGTSYVNNRNIEKGFIYIHEAFQEDKKTHDEDSPSKTGELPKTPAYSTLSLNQTKFNYFRSWVMKITDYLEENYIKSFNIKYSKKFNYLDLSCKFLSKLELTDLVFLFSYTSSRIYDIERNKLIYEKINSLSSIVVSQIFFDLLRIVEGLILYKDNHQQNSFKQHLEYFINNSGLYSFGANNIRLDDFESQRRNDPSKAFIELFSNQFNFSDNNRPPTEIEKDIITALGIRNYYAHNSEPLIIFCENKYEIFKRLFHLLFSVVDNLY